MNDLHLPLIAVAGATGPTGRLVVDDCLRRGYRVLALARRPTALPDRRGLTAVSWTADTAAPDLRGCAAVISALGATDHRHPTTVYSAGTAQLIDGMTAAGVSRFVGISAFGLLAPQGNPLQRIALSVVARLYRHPYDDMRRMEAQLTQAPVDWALVRPPRLTNADERRYAVSSDPQFGTLTRAALATLLVDLAVGITNCRGLVYAITDTKARRRRAHQSEADVVG